ncbi:hypothetical protein OSB04_018252 [Centaurea solstitialis]|uniref:Uncharacterized protein n=1 Tax=Centaurea solstitialis TaxID=347529 RepID=A0AA38WBD4_9ASTR|nr:hypothetical protein OSB04_018252 [Centaurea solstitialis]
MAENKFHPALAVSNVRTFIPIQLEMKNGLYTSWAELFKIHCRAYQVLDHILPPTNTAAAPANKAAAADKELWSRLDAIVLQWIYGTISNELLQTILVKDATASQAWMKLESIFQDNKNARAVYLEKQFTSVHLDDFPSMTDYCQQVKMLADQLANVDAPVSNNRLVLQLISGLNENYDTIASMIQQSDPLPDFFDARSRLILDETRKAKQTQVESSAANTGLVHTADPPLHSHSSASGQPSRLSNSSSNRASGQNRTGAFRGRGRHRGNRGGNRSGNGQTHYSPPWASYTPWGPWMSQQWPVPPPCPYPTSNWHRPAPTNQPGNLKPVKKVGAFCWLSLAICIIELFICIKFGHGELFISDSNAEMAGGFVDICGCGFFGILDLVDTKVPSN